MNRTRLLGFVGFFLFVGFPLLAAGQIAADEGNARIEITDIARLKMPVMNAGAPEHAGLKIEFLDADKPVQTVTQQVTVERGSSILDIALPDLLKLAEIERPHFSWLRMRYTIGEVNGIVSLSRITRQPFALNVLQQREVVPGTRYRVQVLAHDPVTSAPVRGVTISAAITLDLESRDEDRDLVIRARGRTDSRGYAALDFDVPKGSYDDDYASLEVSGRLGAFVQRVDEGLFVSNSLHMVVNTDKPIYQPGQKLRVRALVFDRLRRVLPDLPVDVSISDPDGSDAFKARVLTSSYGEADIEWDIPESASLGDYRIEISPPGPSQAYYRIVRVSRYELPTFTIDVQPDRPYYLPNQDAKIGVQAKYLFGHSVPGARVRIEEDDRYLSSHENTAIEGVTDEQGSFSATLALNEAHGALSDESYSNYRDIRYSVYVTDPTSGRTEQRRFSVRISRHAIHLYVLGEHIRGLPLQFYVSATYADGSPAICDVAIFEAQGGVRRLLGNVKTNRYGVARASGLKPSLEWETGLAESEFELRATDATGGAGTRVHTFAVDEAGVRLHTDRTLYRASDPIAVTFESNLTDGPVVLSVTRDAELVYTTIVQLKEGRATTTIPNSKSFKGTVTLSAYWPGAKDRGSAVGSRSVSFPEKSDLEITMQTGKPSYAPGDEAVVRFDVTDGGGVSQSSLLGITVFDQAVEERARTEAEFGDRYSWCAFCAEYDSGDSGLPGLRQRDISRLDRSKPLASDLELAAEVLLEASNAYLTRPYAVDQVFPYYHYAGAVGSWLAQRRKNPTVHDLPADERGLQQLLYEVDPAFETLRDLWGNPYRLRSSVSYTYNQIQILSAGPDEQFPSPDDFVAGSVSWPFFQQYGALIKNAMRAFHERTGGYIRDMPTLESELLRAGHNFTSWRDPWGSPYRAEFGIARTQFTITILSARGTLTSPVWSEGFDYTEGLWAKVESALSRYDAEERVFPRTEGQFKEALQRGAVGDRDLIDPWGHTFYPVFGSRLDYVDRVTYESRARESTAVVPVTQEVQLIRLRSAGPDGIRETQDDFTVETFARAVSQQAVEDPQPRITESPILNGTAGAIGGFVTDAMGARIPGVSVKITSPDRREIEVLTQEAGDFMVQNLRAGSYRIEFSLTGFQTKTISEVRVRPGVVTHVISALEIGSLNTQVEVSVSGEGLTLMAASASVGIVQGPRQMSLQGPTPVATPRLREFFPETLLWQPSLETGADGRAQVRFKLADSITTWKVAVIASTKDGRVGFAEKEIVSTQPFFLEHDPPKFLTVGDEIALPTIVRSYLDTDQSLELTIKPEPWFAPTDASSQRLDVKAGESTRATFRFKAVAPANDGKQRVTGIGSVASDAVEKTSTVRPNGRRITQSSSRILRGQYVQEIVIPHEAIPGTISSELKVYPDLMAHIVDGIEAIMHRPYGCAEQVISSAYPSVLFLRHSRPGEDGPAALQRRAVGYIRLAYQKLRGYQSSNGGFSYWTNGEPDLAVTAHAVRFLHEAREFISIDEDIYNSAQSWLAGQQSADGSWGMNVQLTSLIARVLASTEVRRNLKKDPIPTALDFLRRTARSSGDPYAMALLALAALDAAEQDIAAEALDFLERNARREAVGAYWNLETNTPFYSWGLPGRLETTALAVQALAAGRSTEAPLVDEGLIFLLQNKDHYGVWYNTQATVRVLDTLGTLIGQRTASMDGSVEIFVNGTRAAVARLLRKGQPFTPVTVDLSKFLKPGANRVEVREKRPAGAATIQLVESHYVPWDQPAEQQRAGALRFSVEYDKTKAAIGDEIKAVVTAERVGFKGYGMMLAEIGLPPGADVDRASLEEAMESAGAAFYKYEVLPDRIVAYLWPRAGGSRFEFKFRTRYGIDAQAPASEIYDYYNPEERVVLPPARFVVQ